MGYYLPFVLTSAILIATNISGFNISNYRLPKYEVPSSNLFSLDLTHPEADTFKAGASLEVTILEPNTKELVLNVDPNYINISSMTLGSDAASLNCSLNDYSAETQLMVLACPNDLYDANFTRPTTFELHYTANFSDAPYGLYKQKIKLNNSESYVIFTQFEPTRFRKVFPSFDEPNIKAPTRLVIDHNENLTVVSNMNYSEDSKTFLNTPNMSTYLVAIVAGPNETWTLYPSLQGGIEAYNFSIFAQRIHADYVWSAKENGPILINLMSEYTGIPYETLGNSKMTFAALPGMGGAMENWGLITFRDSILVSEADLTPHKNIMSGVTTMAHEIAHQWFGDYVTLNWWSEVWLNEGFATYFEWYLPNLFEDEYEYDKMFLINVFQPALQQDSPDMDPLSDEESKVNTEEEIRGNFGVVSYNKGASVIRMISHALGEDVFQKALQTYLKDNSLKNVKASNLIDHLQAALPNTTDVNLTTYLSSWIYEPGYPILRTSIGESGRDSYIVSIDAYIFEPSLNNTDRQPGNWWVPVTYATSDQQFWDNATTYWINPGRTFEYYLLNSSDSWGVLNVHASGYYRVDYDTNSLARIFNVLNSSATYTQIPVLNRAQLIDDLFNIAKYYTERQQGYDNRPYKNAFSFVQYLRHEEEYYPWFTYLKEVQYLLDNLEDETTIQTLKADVLELIEEQLVIPNDTYIWYISPPEALRTNLLIDWACKLGHEDAIEYAKGKFDVYKTNPKSIDNNFRDLIICNGLQKSNDPNADYATLIDFYAKSILPQEQIEILVGLTCITDPAVLDKYLETTLEDDPPIAEHFWSDIFAALVNKRGPVGLEAAVRFISNNANAIIQKWKEPMNIGKMIKAVSSKIVKTKDTALLSNLINTFGANTELGHDVVLALAIAETHSEWLDKFEDEITSVLVYGGAPIPTPDPGNDNDDGNNSATTLYSFTGIALLVGSIFIVHFA